jgi:hypothetical protein
MANTQVEALKLALEALEWEDCNDDDGLENAQRKAITAIKAALEANEFNPDWDTQAVLVEEIQRMAKRIEELEAKGEPVCDKDPQGCWSVRCQLGNQCKNTPPQRTWVELTEDEAFTCQQRDYFETYKAIEAKLRSKND